jgi:hypothetical protein
MASFVFNNAQSVREVCAGSYKTEAALQAVVVAAIAAVIATGELFTCTAAASGYSQRDIQNILRDLISLGFTATFSGTTITIAW